MKDFKIKNKAGLELTVTKAEPEDYAPIMGGNSDNPTWAEYLKDYKTKYKPNIRLVRRALIEMDLIGECASEWANDLYFVFSDGTNIGFSWRAWGDLMQAIVNKKEGYMTYYM